MRGFKKWLAIAALVACSPLALAGAIGIGDFSGAETVTTFDALGLPFSNPTPIVFDGNTYTTDDGTLRYANTFAANCSNDCIGNNTDLGYIDIALGSAVTRVGALVGLDVTWSGSVQFFDLGDVLLGTVSFTDATQLEFAGWENAAGIGRMRVIDQTENSLIIHMDDFRFEGAAPEPGTLALIALAFVGAGGAWRSRRRR